MKLTLTLALLLATSKSIRIEREQSYESEPSDEMRLLMDDGFTHVIKYGHDQNLIQYIDVSSPFDDRVVLAMFPKKQSLTQSKEEPSSEQQETSADKKSSGTEAPKKAPDSKEKKEKKNGSTPKEGQNIDENIKSKEKAEALEEEEKKLTPEQKNAKQNKIYEESIDRFHKDRKEEVTKMNAAIQNLQRCPEYAEERDSLVNGITGAIPYPQHGYNCRDYTIALVQKKKDPETEHDPKKEAPVPKPVKEIGADIASLEHCPDFDERYTLKDGVTKGIPYPSPGYNCNYSFALGQSNKNVNNLDDNIRI